MTTSIKVGNKVMLKSTVKGGITEQDYSIVANAEFVGEPYSDGTSGVLVDPPIAGLKWWNSEDLVVVDGDD